MLNYVPLHLIIINLCPEQWGHSTATPQLMSGWLGLVGFDRAKERRLHFVQCIFGQILAGGGG